MLLKSKEIIAILTAITLLLSLTTIAFAEPPAAPPDGFQGDNSGEPPSAPPEGGMGGPGGGQNVSVNWSGATEITSATTETGKTYNSETANENALLIDTNEAVTLSNITVSKTGDSDGGDATSFYGTNAGILVKGGSNTTITGATITTDASGANGVFSYGGNGAQNGAAGDGTTVNISDTTIHTTGNGSGGIMTTGGGVTNANNLTVVTEGGSSAPIRTDRGGGTVTVTGGSYTSNGLGSPAVYSTADITVNDAELTSNLSEGVCIEGKNSVTFNNVNLTANNTQMNGNATFLDTIMIYQSMSGDADSGTSSFTATGGTINSKNGHVFHITNTNAVITLNGVTINNSDSENVLLSVCDDGWNGAGNIAALNANSQELSGNILVGSNSSLTLNLNNSSVFTGAISGNITNAKGQTVSDSVGTVNVTLDETSKWYLTADTYVSSFDGNAANVITNGYTLYVNGAALDGTTAADTAKSDISVSVNGKQVDFSAYDNVKPYIESDRTLIPIRALAENMGFTVDWDDATKTVTVKGGDTEITLVIDSNKATVNGETYTLDVPARITSDRTFIPLRFVSENMGATVDWNDADRSIAIAKDNILAKIDNTKWQYSEENKVYWQTGITYCANPADTAYETLGIFVPSAYMTASDNGDGTYTCVINNDTAINGYTAKTAPIVIPINTPGYSAMNPPTGYDSSTVSYTDAGFVYVYAGARGRNEGAPAGVTDFKAAIRYIRYNGDLLAGDKDSIFSFGMSGGGAQSALIGTTGNSELYTPYLNAIGAANERDDVKGSMCWCPITNLDIANEAYEWNMGITRSDLDNETQALSEGLADAFADYINEIKLTDENGTVLLLEQDENGAWTKGTYYDYIKSEIERSLNNFLADTTFPYTKQASGGFGGMMGGGFGGQKPNFANGEKPDGMEDTDNANMPIEAIDGINRNTNNTQTAEDAKTYQTAEEYIADLNGDNVWIVYDKNTNTAKITSIEAFVKACKTASKSVGAFDDLNAAQGENTLFGYGDGKGAHFDSIMAKLLENTEYAQSYNTDLAKTDALGNGVTYRLNMYTPMYYIDDMYEGYKTSDVAKYFRIRTGINQGDTALSTEINLALALQKYGSDVDFEMVWGQGHTKAERGDQTEDSSDKNFMEWVNECMK